MKYAFIVLIAIYLVTYGCSSDKSEETQSSHEQTATTTLENPPHSETAAAPADQHEPAPSTAPEQHQTAAAEPTAATAPAAGAEAAADSTAAAPEQAGMPCCGTKAKADAAAESEQVVMPCGKMMARGDIPENAPCLGMQDMDVMAMPDSDQELSAAMQRMVETTNGVIVATRELVSATYLMLNAGKEVAGEIIESGKDTAQGEGDKQAAEQTAETAPEQEVVETMQQFISAAREVIDATNRAIYSVVAEKKTN